MVGPPKVINKMVNDKLLEPFEVCISLIKNDISLINKSCRQYEISWKNGKIM